MKPKNLTEIFSWTEEQAREYLEKIRWYNRVSCPHCKSHNVMKLQRKEGTKVRPGVWKCRGCRKQFTVTTGTIFHGSHIPLIKWVGAFYLMCSSKKGISANQLKRDLGLTYKSAWFMAHRIRYAMKSRNLGKLEGIVEVDETYIGKKGKDKFGSPFGLKSKVVVLVERNGKARTDIVQNLKHERIKKVIRKNVDENSTIMTDEYSSYTGIGKYFKGGHKVIKHAEKYVNGDIYTNTAECYFSLLKRGIIGIYQHVSKKHLSRYCDEFSFRWNLRKTNEENMLRMAVKMGEGKRMKYKNRIKSYLKPKNEENDK